VDEGARQTDLFVADRFVCFQTAITVEHRDALARQRRRLGAAEQAAAGNGEEQRDQQSASHHGQLPFGAGAGGVAGGAAGAGAVGAAGGAADAAESWLICCQTWRAPATSPFLNNR